MKFDVNHPIIFVIVGIIIAVVLGQSVYFLVRALKRAKELGIKKTTIKKTISSSAIFTVAPAISVLIGVLTLSKSLGVALPWLRLSVIGSLSYETVAAGNALNSAGLTMANEVTSPSIFITIAWVMTIGIAAGLILVPFLTKGIQKGFTKIGMKDKKWGDILSNAMFLGMISAFLGYVFSNVERLWKADGNGIVTVVEKVKEAGIEKEVEHYFTNTSGLVPVLVMVVSAIVMAVFGILIKKSKIRWLSDYALPISLVAGMAAAIPLTNWLGGEIK